MNLEPLINALGARGTTHRLIGRSLLILDDAVALAPILPNAGAVISDPPYPNAAGHFDDDVAAAVDFMALFPCDHWMIFWDELLRPPVPHPLVAIHVWHRTNSNRPDNYEPVFEFHQDGRKRASRVLPFPVVFPGLTGCREATGHPTQKNLKLMRRLVQMAKPSSVIDPFMGSGTTIEACHGLDIPCIGIERDARHFADAVARVERDHAAPRLL